MVAAVCNARTHKSRGEGSGARVPVVQQLLPLVYVLLLLSLCLHQDRKRRKDQMTWIVVAVLALVAVTQQATMGCKNCIILGKEEKAMFRAHSDACLPVSHVDQRLVDAMLAGELIDEPQLRKHVYCILLKCKLISKDGKLLKNAVLGKMAVRPDVKNATKVLESCAEQSGDTPEYLAWNLFRCGYDKKALLFEYMPTNSNTGSGDTDNTN